MNRTQFTFYESFFKAISRIRQPADRAAAYDAICAYALHGEEPDMDSMPDAAAIAFELIKPNLDASRKKAMSGHIGGTSKHASSKKEANAKQEQPGTEKENEKEGEKEKEDKCPPPISPSRGTRFTPPTLEEVRAYCLERQNGVDPEKWYDHYTSNGWKVGKNSMKDWKAAVRTWERQEIGPPKQERRQSGNVFLEMLDERRGMG